MHRYLIVAVAILVLGGAARAQSPSPSPTPSGTAPTNTDQLATVEAQLKQMGHYLIKLNDYIQCSKLADDPSLQKMRRLGHHEAPKCVKPVPTFLMPVPVNDTRLPTTK
jgi:hypothetical protein